MTEKPGDLKLLPSFTVPASVERLPRRDARQWIDTAIGHFEGILRALKSNRNSKAAIHVLPDEILLEIFHIFISQCFQSQSYNRYADRLLTSGVCSRWRTVSLGAPTLWSTIDLANRTLAREFLIRSRQAPLDTFLRHDATPEKMNSIVNLLEPHLKRIRMLRFAVRWTSMEILVSMLKSPAPLLERLCLSLHYGRRMPSTPMLVKDLFGGNAPSLRQLYLDHVSIPWTVPMYRHLVDLELIGQHDDAVPSIEEFLAMLGSSPGLRRLVLTSAGPRCPDKGCIALIPAKPVSMPNLTEITLNNRAADTAYVLSHMIVPPTTSISLSCCADISTPTFSSVLPRDCSGLQSLSEIAYLEFKCEAGTAISLLGKTADGRDNFILEVWPDEFLGALDPRAWFIELGEVFALPRLTRLQVANSSPCIDDCDWVDVLARFPLRELEVSGFSESPLSLFRALQRSGPGTPHEDQDVVCPKLETLSMEGLEMDDVALPLAHECFRHRLSQGSPLQTLKLGVSPGMTPAKQQHLEEVIHTVEYEDMYRW